MKYNVNMEWFSKFPEMGRGDLREFKKSVDLAFTNFSRTYGEGLENFFEPLLTFLIGFERFFINTPWPIIIIIILTVCWFASRSLIIVCGTLISFLVIGFFGMWENTMATLAISMYYYWYSYWNIYGKK